MYLHKNQEDSQGHKENLSESNKSENVERLKFHQRNG